MKLTSFMNFLARVPEPKSESENPFGDVGALSNQIETMSATIATLTAENATLKNDRDAQKLRADAAEASTATEKARADKAEKDLADAKAALPKQVANQALAITLAQGQPPIEDKTGTGATGEVDHIAIHAALLKTDPVGATAYYRANKAAYDAQFRQRNK